MRQYALEDLVLGNILEEKARTDGNRTFLKFREGEYTYAEVNQMADRMARGLAAKGIRQHDHVAVILPNCAEIVFTVFALAKLGAVSIPINTAYKGDILHHVLATSDASMLIVDESLLEQVALDRMQLPNLNSVVVRTDSNAAATPKGLHKPVVSLDDLLVHGRSAPRAAVKHSDIHTKSFFIVDVALSRKNRQRNSQDCSTNGSEGPRCFCSQANCKLSGQ